MKSTLAILAGILLCNQVSSQSTIGLTPAIEKKINLNVEKQVSIFKLRLAKEKTDPAIIEFTIDTFRVETFMTECLQLDNSDFGMSEIGYKTAALYDSLLNKYYRKLSGVLKGDDKKNLTQAQKSWITFRDNETKLVETISKAEYSGGGTMQRLTESSGYLTLIKNRVITIFEHYLRATQTY